MMIDDTQKWPKYLPGFGPDDLIAIGVIALNYGQLESRLRDLCAAAIGMKPAKFYDMRNDKRIQKLRENLPADFTAELKEDIEYFLECYKTCAGNRHAVMHSSIGGEYSDASRSERGLILSKYSNAGQQLFCSARISDLHRVADEVHQVMLYGVGMMVRVNMFFDHRDHGKLDVYRKHLRLTKPPKPTELQWEPLKSAKQQASAS